MKKITSIKTRITIWYTSLMFVLIFVVLSLVGGLSYQLSIDSVEKDVILQVTQVTEKLSKRQPGVFDLVSNKEEFKNVTIYEPNGKYIVGQYNYDVENIPFREGIPRRESIDGKEHNVTVKFTVSEELVLNTKGEGRALAYPVRIPGMTAIRMGNGIQNVLWRSGDDIRIDWGYLYLGVKGAGKAEHTILDGMYAVSVEAAAEREALFIFAYDDIDSIQYFGENLKAYWKKDGKTIEEAIEEAVNEYDTLLERCNSFSDRIKS